MLIAVIIIGDDPTAIAAQGPTTDRDWPLS
jgi:hypothetical protein